MLLGATEYSTAVDMWSLGCIFGELILKEPLLPGKGEIDQLAKVSLVVNRLIRGSLTPSAFQIFKLLGKPTEDMWPGFSNLPNAKSYNLSAAPPFGTLFASLLSFANSPSLISDFLPSVKHSDILPLMDSIFYHNSSLTTQQNESRLKMPSNILTSRKVHYRNTVIYFLPSLVLPLERSEFNFLGDRVEKSKC